MIGWKTIAALLFAHRCASDNSERVDAALAETIQAQEEVKDEASRVVDAAVSNSLHIQKVRSEIHGRIAEQEKRALSKKLHTGDVRGLVQGMLDSIDSKRDPKEGEKPC